MLTQTDAIGNVTSYNYAPNGLSYSKTEAGKVFNYGLDGAGNIITNKIVANGGGSTMTTNKYDGFNRAIETKIYNEQQLYSTQKNSYMGDCLKSQKYITKDLLKTIAYEYEGGNCGKPKQRVVTVSARKKTSYTTDNYEYDSFGRPNTITTPQYTITNTYDNAGNLYTEGYSNGKNIIYGYNGNGKVTTKIVIAMGSITVSTSYDNALGKVKTVSGAGPAVTYSYDPAGRLTSISEDGVQQVGYTYNQATGLLETTSYANGNKTTTFYTPDGNSVDHIVSTGNNKSIINYGYATVNGVKQVLKSKQVNISSTPSMTLSHTYEYDGWMNINKDTFTSPYRNATISSTFNSLGQLTHAEYLILPNNYLYKYDYAYDGLNRLIARHENGYEHDIFEYDANNNLTGSWSNNNIWNGNYEYNLANQITKTPNGMHFTYDIWGNFYSFGSGEHTSIQHYDALNRLVTYQTPDFWNSLQIQYQYNSLGLMIRRTETGKHTDIATVTKFRYDGEQNLIDIIESGPDNSYFISRTNNINYFCNQNQYCYYPVIDSLGSIREMFSSNGQSKQFNYTSYGFNYGDKVFKVPLGWNQEFTDPTVGLIYLKSRWYDPNVGAFQSPDDIKSDNLYNYANGNPIAYVDPDGHWPKFRWLSSLSQRLSRLNPCRNGRCSAGKEVCFTGETHVLLTESNVLQTESRIETHAITKAIKDIKVGDIVQTEVKQNEN